MKLKILFTLALLFAIQLFNAQNTKLIDSLKLELESRKKDDSIKVIILTRLHEKLMFSKPEEALKYAKRELETFALKFKNHCHFFQYFVS